MHIVVRRYKIQPNSGSTLMENIHSKFEPIIRTAQGFVSYNAFINQNGELCSVSIFNDKNGAEGSNQLAKEYIQKENLSSYFLGAPEILQGEVGASS
jgi:hypothetical protein